MPGDGWVRVPSLGHIREGRKSQLVSLTSTPRSPGQERSEACKTQGVASAPSPFIVLLGQITPLPNPQVAIGDRALELLEVMDRLRASGSFSSSLGGGGRGWSSAILCPLCWEAVGGLEGKGLSLLPPPVHPRCLRDVGRGGPTQPSHSYPCRAPDLGSPRIEGEALAGPPAQPHPFPSALTLGGSHHGNPKVRGGWGAGDQLLLPFVFPLLFFVSSFFPVSALGGPSALSPPWSSPRLLCDFLLLSHFLHCWLFSWAFVFPCLVSLFLPL